VRIRTIKPAFFMNDEMASLDPLARLLFIGLLCMADCAGRLEDRPARIRAEILPYESGADISALIETLAQHHFIIRYTIDGVKLLQITNFNKHQRITGSEAEASSAFPQPPDSKGKRRGATRKQSGNTQETLRTTGREGKGREGKGITLCASDDARPAPHPASPHSNPFDQFWSEYPVKKGKGDAKRSWERQRLDSKLPEILAKLVIMRTTDSQWLNDGGKYIPHPASWLNATGWEDEATPAPIFSPTTNGSASYRRDTASAIDLPTLCDRNMPAPPFDWRAMLPVLYDAATPEDIHALATTPWGLVPIEIRNELTRHHHQHSAQKSA